MGKVSLQRRPRAAKAAERNVLNQMRDLIRGKRLQPRMKLPPERDLAAELRVGRPAVREARLSSSWM